MLAGGTRRGLGRDERRPLEVESAAEFAEAEDEFSVAAVGVLETGDSIGVAWNGRTAGGESLGGPGVEFDVEAIMFRDNAAVVGVGWRGGGRVGSDFAADVPRRLPMEGVGEQEKSGIEGFAEEDGVEIFDQMGLGEFEGFAIDRRLVKVWYAGEHASHAVVELARDSGEGVAGERMFF